MKTDVHVLLVSWHWNLNAVYHNLAFYDSFIGELRIRLLEDILFCQQSARLPYW